MTADDCIAALEEARNALDQHYRACDKAFEGAHNALGCEARKRVNQMIWLLSEIGRLLQECDDGQRPQFELAALLQSGQITPEEASERMQSPALIEASRSVSRASEPLQTLTEAFYWIAGRTRSVIRALPNMRAFEAEGVRNTRNHLLEHPDSKHSGVLITSFGWGAEIGPIIKGPRFAHQSHIWPDRGLFINATEFAENLRRNAEQATAAIEESESGK